MKYIYIVGLEYNDITLVNYLIVQCRNLGNLILKAAK